MFTENLTRNVTILIAFTLLSTLVFFLEHTGITKRNPVPLECCYPWLKNKSSIMLHPHDNTLVHYPFWLYQMKGLRHGKIRLWNPYVFSGTPMWVNIPALCNPLNILGVIFPSETGFILINFLWLLALGIGFKILAQELGLSEISSFFVGYLVTAGYGFQMGGYAYHDYLPSMALMPFTLFFIHRFFSHPCRAYFYFALSVLLHGLMYLTSNPIMSFYFSMFYLSYFIFSFFANRSKTKLNVLSFFMMLLIFFISGIFLGSAQFFPTLDFILQGNRYTEIKTSWIWSPFSLIQIFLPKILNQEVTVGVWHRTYAQLIQENTPFPVSYEGFYLGIVPLLSLFFISRKNMTYSFRFFTVWTGIIIVFLAGSSLPLLYGSFIYQNPFTNATLPGRLLTLSLSCFALLAGLGLDNLIKRRNILQNSGKRLFYFGMMVLVLWSITYSCFLKFKPSIKEKILISAEMKKSHENKPEDNYYPLIARGILESAEKTLKFHLYLPGVFVILGLLLKKKARSFIFYSCLTVIILLDNFIIAGRTSGMNYPFALHYPETPAIPLLKNLSQKGRIVFFPKKNESSWTIPGELDYLYTPVFPPDTFSFFELRSINGYQGVILRRYFNLIKAAGGMADIRSISMPDPANPVLSLLSARYAVASPGANLPLPYVRIYDKEVSIWENKKVNPEVYFAHKINEVADEKEALKWLERKKFNPGTKEVVIENNGGGISFNKTNSTADEAKLYLTKNYNFQKIIIHVKTKSRGALIINNPYTRGWHATVDGEKSKIYPANVAFQAILLSEGKHEIILKYMPLSFLLGILFSITGNLLTGLLIILIRKKKVANHVT